MLRIKHGNIGFREIWNQHVFPYDVERANLAERLSVRAYLRLVVPYVQHPDKRDGFRERNHLAVHIAVAQLSKERYQDIANKTVRLVEEHDNRLADNIADIRQYRSHGKHDLSDIYRHRRQLCFARKTWNPLGITDYQFPNDFVSNLHISCILQRLQRTVYRRHLAFRVDLAD